MSHRSPLVTAAGSVIVFAALIAANMIDDARHPEAGPPAATATSSAAPSSAAPSSAAPTSAAPTGTPPTPPPSTVPPPTASPTATKSASEDRFPNKVVYAGHTKEGHVALAVAVLGEKAAAYLCDGRTVEAWLRGSATNGRLDLSGSHGSKLEARLAGTRIKGRVRVSGRWLPFEIGVAAPPAGLYRAKGARTTIGWIVLPDGSQVGVESDGGATKAAPRLDPDNPTVTANGERLDATPVTGDESV